MRSLHRPSVLFAALLAIVPAAAQTGQNTNHALTGTATQSADHPAWPLAVAGKAIDGNRNGIWADGSCSYTASMAAPWWQVAFAAPSLVHEIVIHPRSDANPVTTRDLLVELKSGAAVVWSQFVATGQASPPRGKAIRLLLPAGGVTGDVVRISRPNVANEPLLLAEVEVLQNAPIPPVNQAIYGTATQITTTTGHDAANAIDGNTDGNLQNGSSAQSSVNGASYQDWWQVTLPRRRYDEIRIWPCTFQPAYPYYVTAYDGATSVGQWFADNPPLTGPFVVTPGTATNPYIDRVRVWRNSFPSPLFLAEVEVINWSAIDAEAKPFGIGCQGTAGIPVLRPTTPPVLQSNFDVALTNVPANPGLAVIATGFSYTSYGALPLPFDLEPLGGAGCQGYVAPDVLQSGAAAGGVLSSTINLPNNSGLIGAEVYQQGFVLDPTTNVVGLVTSNALRVRLGL